MTINTDFLTRCINTLESEPFEQLRAATIGPIRHRFLRHLPTAAYCSVASQTRFEIQDMSREQIVELDSSSG